MKLEVLLPGVYSFGYNYTERIEQRFIPKLLGKEIESMLFSYTQGYSGLLVVKTINKGDFFYVLAESNKEELFDVEFEHTKCFDGKVIDVKNDIISEIIIELGFNHLSKNKLHLHKCSLAVNIN